MKTMKTLLLGMSIVLFVHTTSSAKKTDTQKEGGISFYQGSWEEALQLAKNENKPIFLDISASWCGPCKMLKATTFPNADVGEFYNSNFINVAVDGEIGAGIELAKMFEIRGYPSLVFLNSQGKLIAKTAGYRAPKQFIELGMQAIENQ